VAVIVWRLECCSPEKRSGLSSADNLWRPILSCAEDSAHYSRSAGRPIFLEQLFELQSAIENLKSEIILRV